MSASGCDSSATAFGRNVSIKRRYTAPRSTALPPADVQWPSNAHASASFVYSSNRNISLEWNWIRWCRLVAWPLNSEKLFRRGNIAYCTGCAERETQLNKRNWNFSATTLNFLFTKCISDCPVYFAAVYCSPILVSALVPELIPVLGSQVTEAINPAVGCRFFAAAEHRCPLTGTKLHCGACIFKQLIQGCSRQRGGRDMNPRPVDRKSNTLATRPPRHTLQSDIGENQTLDDKNEKVASGSVQANASHSHWQRTLRMYDRHQLAGLNDALHIQVYHVFRSLHNSAGSCRITDPTPPSWDPAPPFGDPLP